MLPRSPRLFIFASLVAFFSGCATTDDSSAADRYQPPAPGPTVAMLKGSSLSEGGMFGSEHRCFVAMVDLQSIPNAASNWNVFIPLSPGNHTVVGEYRYSNFMSRAYLPFEAKAGVSYQLMIKNGHEADGRLYAEFWIIEVNSGKAVTPVYHRQASGGKKGTLFYMNK